jgi:hypothetical protein
LTCGGGKRYGKMRELEGGADWYWEKRVYAKVLEGWVECE